MASFPYWLGTPPITSPTNTITIDTQISTLTLTNTTVNIVPQVLLATRSTTTLNTGNPSELLSYVVPETGWFKSDWVGVASHAGGGSGADWSNFSQLDWYMTRNNGIQSNTAVIVQPRYICGDSVSEFVSIPGTGVIPATAGDTLQWVCDGNATPAQTSNYFGGFGWVTIQKIG